MALLPVDGVVVEDKDAGRPSSSGPHLTGQLVSNVKMGVFSPSDAIVVVFESKRKGDGNAELLIILGLTMLMLMLGLLFVLFAFGLPALEDGLYLHSVPQVRQREQIGRALLHLTFARKQPSQLARKRWIRGFAAAFEFDIPTLHNCRRSVFGGLNRIDGIVELCLAWSPNCSLLVEELCSVRLQLW